MIFFLKVLPHLLKTMYLVLSMFKAKRFFSQYFFNFARENFNPIQVGGHNVSPTGFCLTVPKRFEVD